MNKDINEREKEVRSGWRQKGHTIDQTEQVIKRQR